MTGNGKVNVMPFAQKPRKPHVHYLLHVISSVLEELVRAGEQQKVEGGLYRHGINNTNRQASKFNGLHPPSISIGYYLERIAQFSGCSDECFVLMLIYIDRLVTKKNILLDAYNVHRLIISAILLSAKFFDDHFFFNPHFALVGGLQEHEMNTLELEFLFLIEFNLYVRAEDYQTYYNTLARMAHSRFINNSLPPIPNVPHDEANLPRPLSPPPQRLLPPDDMNVAIPLPNLKHKTGKKMENDNNNYQHGQVLDQQWVHIEPDEAGDELNSSGTFSDYTMVEKSPSADSHNGMMQHQSLYQYMPHNGYTMHPGYVNGYVSGSKSKNISYLHPFAQQGLNNIANGNYVQVSKWQNDFRQYHPAQEASSRLMHANVDPRIQPSSQGVSYGNAFQRYGESRSKDSTTD